MGPEKRFCADSQTVIGQPLQLFVLNVYEMKEKSHVKAFVRSIRL